MIGGAVAPVIVFILARRWPRSWLRNINVPVFLNGPLFCPPASGINYGTFILVGAYFQWYRRRTNFAWWSKVSHPSFFSNDLLTNTSTITLLPLVWMQVRLSVCSRSGFSPRYLVPNFIGGVQRASRTVSPINTRQTAHAHTAQRLMVRETLLDSVSQIKDTMVRTLGIKGREREWSRYSACT